MIIFVVITSKDSPERFSSFTILMSKTLSYNNKPADFHKTVTGHQVRLQL